MKHLLSGVAIIAALAVAAPAWAQMGPKASGGTSAKPTPAPMAPAKPAAAPMAPAAGKPMHHHHRRVAHHRAAPEDSMTEQLNQQELARIQGGGGAAPAPAGDRLAGPKVGPK